MTRFLLCILLSIPLIGAGQVYKSVDENGNTVYSDTPPPGATASEQVQIGITNSAPPPPHVARPAPIAQREDKKVETSVEIISPATDTTISIGYAGNFTVEAAVKPSLMAGWTAQLFMDGEATSEPQAGTTWALAQTYRGSHVLTVELTDAQGKALASSSPVTVHVLRAMVGR